MYLSTVQVSRMFRDGQPINYIRVDFRSNEDVQKIPQCSHISIDSIRYPAVPCKCGENHEYNRDCVNAVNCANCNATRREERNQSTGSTSYLSSPVRVYWAVLQTMAPHVHAVTKTCKMTPDRPSGQIDQSSIIINALKEETGRSQEVLLNRITQLEVKSDAVHEQQAALRWTIETQIVPYMSTMSELLVDVWEQLAKAKVIKLTDQQQTKIRRLRHPPTTSQLPFSPSVSLSSQ
jgi:hypothetical protein